MGPIRRGLFYGFFGALVAAIADLYFLYLNPAETEGWVMALVQTYRTRLALAAYLFLAILAALRVRPTRLDAGASYRSLLLRDCALAATVVAVVVGITLFLLTALTATVFADEARAYAREASPKIAAYVNEEIVELREGRIERGDDVGKLPPRATVGEIETALQPPSLRDLGRSIANFVLRAILLGTAGALVGLLRGGARSNAPSKPTQG